MEFSPSSRNKISFTSEALNGLFGVEKKNKTLESGQPVLRVIINAIPTNALQEMIEADIRTMPYFVQWSGISVEEEDRVVVWNEMDKTSAFCVFRLEPQESTLMKELQRSRPLSPHQPKNVTFGPWRQWWPQQGYPHGATLDRQTSRRTRGSMVVPPLRRP